MKISTLAVAILITAAAPALLASTAAEREYQRGFNDCSHGRYDQNQHGESYKKGCRAAEDGQKAKANAPAGNHGSTAAEREYQRGFNDCSHGRYDQNQHGESYKKGCRAAEDGQKSGAPSAKQAPAATSGASKVKLSDLKGMDSIKAFDVMTARGFKSVDSLTAGETIYGTYYNAKTHQCVQLTTAHDRVESIDDVPSHPQCR